MAVSVVKDVVQISIPTADEVYIELNYNSC